MTNEEKNQTRRALRLIRKAQPKTNAEALAFGIGPLDKIGEGAFRAAYQIRGTSLLIKFPLGGYKCHTRAEVRKIQKLSQFKSMRAHVPPVYYYNSKDGVMVTKFYAKGARLLDMNEVVSKLIKELTGVVLEDIVGDNVKSDGRHPVFVDLGY